MIFNNNKMKYLLNIIQHSTGAFYLDMGLKRLFLFSFRFGLLPARPWLCSLSDPVVLGCSAVTVVKFPIWVSASRSRTVVPSLNFKLSV